ncbi:protein kinase domain-containing protein [Novipirellula sp. SH528]|uniref:serine/threonine-protein kinase n=1 Tax=Novipirellula sp. SH528 TaxID=3454466 RepID=UPI003FA0E668
MMKCDDIAFDDLLDADDDIDTHNPDIARHVESCAYCQSRLAGLAADAEQWDEMQRWLSTADVNDSEDADLLDADERWKHPVAWNEAMAKTLLSQASHPEMLGRIGRYDVERLIGSGGMGVVFKAYDTELNRPVAVKLLAPYLASSGAARKRFAREARAAAAVVDDHVVPIHNVETDDEHPFLVMKYIAGGSLQQRLDRDGPLDVCEVLRIGTHTAKGLAAAHAQGLIHRDVKPSNILLDEGVDRALLTDFGLARATDDASLTRSGFHPGTPHYMSPEQVRGDAIDARSDLFGLGCVLYALCTSHPPFRSETSYAVLRRVTDDAPRSIREINANIPLWLEQIVMKLLAKSPGDRFDSAEQVAELLEDCLAHVQHPTTTLLPKSIAALAPEQSRRPPIGKFIAAAAFAFSLLFAGVLIVLELNKGTLTIQSVVDDVPIRIVKGGETVERLRVHQSGEKIRIASGDYVVMIDGPIEGITVSDGQVSLQRGGDVIVNIVRSTNPIDTSTVLATHVVEIDLGDSQFAVGDEIEIQSVTSSGNGFEVGATVMVKGVYTLESAKTADLCFFSTTTLGPEENPTPTPIQPSQRIQATSGTHEFTLSKVITTTGSSHVSFYHPTTGEGMGGVYFAEANRSKIAEAKVDMPTGLEREIQQVLSSIDAFNRREDRGPNSPRSQRWGSELQLLVNYGSAAVPSIVRELDQTRDDRMIATLAFALRAIGDKRGVPALIRAIPRTSVPSTKCNWIRSDTIIDEDLVSFFKQNRFTGQGDAAIGCSDAPTELSCALAELTGQDLGLSRVFGVGMPQQLYLQQRALHRDAQRWAKWWDANSADLVEDAAFRIVNVPSMTMEKPPGVEPNQILAKIFWRTSNQLQSLQIAADATEQERAVFLDLDTGRSESVPTAWRGRNLSESDRADLFAWAEQEGFDLVCDQYKTDDGSQHYVLRGLGLKAWQVDEVQWEAQSHYASLNQVIDEGKEVSGDWLIPFSEEKHSLDPTTTAPFLVVTREGTPVLLYEGAEVTEKVSPDATTYADDLHRPTGFVDGRKLAIMFFEPLQNRGEEKASGDVGPLHDMEPNPTTGDQASVKNDIATPLVGERTLAEAVREFNHLHSKDAQGRPQPPLTSGEVYTCLQWKLGNGDFPEKIRAGMVSMIFSKNRIVPAGWQLTGGLVRHRCDQGTIQTWEVNLETHGLSEPVSIRRMSIAPPAAIQTPSEALGNDEIAAPLATGIAGFNAAHKPTNGIAGIHQTVRSHGLELPPLTLDEVLAAIALWQTKRNEADVDNATFERFQRIARTHQLPSDIRFEFIPSFENAIGEWFYIWSVQILVPQVAKPGSTYAFTIRQHYLDRDLQNVAAIHWGKPAENGLQAGFRLIPSQQTYEIGQIVDVEFFYRSTTGAGVPATLDNAFTYRRAELRGDVQFGKVVDVQQKTIPGGAVKTVIGDKPTVRKGQRIQFCADADPEVEDGVGTKLIVEPGKGYRLVFVVSNPGDDSDDEDLETGRSHYINTPSLNPRKELPLFAGHWYQHWGRSVPGHRAPAESTPDLEYNDPFQIGVSLGPADKNRIPAYYAGGLTVTRVAPHSPAEAVGIEVGDTLLAWEGNQIDSNDPSKPFRYSGPSNRLAAKLQENAKSMGWASYNMKFDLLDHRSDEVIAIAPWFGATAGGGPTKVEQVKRLVERKRLRNEP